MKIHNFDLSFVDPAMLASACRYHRIEGPQLCLSCKYFLKQLDAGKEGQALLSFDGNPAFQFSSCAEAGTPPEVQSFEPSCAPSRSNGFAASGSALLQIGKNKLIGT
nr:hypothetical protein Iba_chr01cCG7840 [Ipomoea batatas]GMD68448.1 hypothetical protein Iba_chr12dCG9260 [Ipomoea batatas]GMD69957.1 hypothetical protein Iba_chr12eCG1650 [Ipomoea batatas]